MGDVPPPWQPGTPPPARPASGNGLVVFGIVNAVTTPLAMFMTLGSVRCAGLDQGVCGLRLTLAFVLPPSGFVLGLVVGLVAASRASRRGRPPVAAAPLAWGVWTMVVLLTAVLISR